VKFQRTSVGLDVHARSVVGCGLDRETGEVFQRRLTPSREEVRDWIRSLLRFESVRRFAPRRCGSAPGPRPFNNHGMASYASLPAPPPALPSLLISWRIDLFSEDFGRRSLGRAAGSTENEDTPSQLIDARIKELSDWRTEEEHGCRGASASTAPRATVHTAQGHRPAMFSAIPLPHNSTVGV
jgi:hypothetical protein